MSIKAFCIHGHFYQPPREDPLTDIIPIEKGAAPFSNWNERIVDDCYRPNAEEGNFGNMSFNIGPTLAEWLEKNHPAVLNRIIADDNFNFQKTQAGNALAQPFHHTILPLASRHDKTTQIIWGIHAFRKLYGRVPKGMWLPETAVDMVTLEIMATNGIEFTILAPWQSTRTDLDTTQPYLVRLGGKKCITVFFYEQDISSNISFNPSITSNADEFAQKTLTDKYPSSDKDQLILIASDGELYGHHQKFRYKFLKQLFNQSLFRSGIQPTYLEMWLKDHPPKEFVEIAERTSWSCMHELRRWSGICDCTPHPEWKAPLRNALDAVADKLDQVFFNETKKLIKDPWDLRNFAINTRDPNFNLQDKIHELGGKTLNSNQESQVMLLLRSQFERQRMFASCAWFFEDFDRIEPQNAARYAAFAVHLAEKATHSQLTRDLLPAFEKVKSNRSDLNAGEVFSEFLERVSIPQ
jgi:alpha-amylase/alpha-mannosidase (GH57 family)